VEKLGRLFFLLFSLEVGEIVCLEQALLSRGVLEEALPDKLDLFQLHVHSLDQPLKLLFVVVVQHWLIFVLEETLG
jgi:hypothetical protein